MENLLIDVSKKHVICRIKTFEIFELRFQKENLDFFNSLNLNWFAYIFNNLGTKIS